MNSLGVFANILGAANTAAVMFTNEASCNMSQPGPTTVPVTAVLVLVYSFISVFLLAIGQCLPMLIVVFMLYPFAATIMCSIERSSVP